MARAKFRTTGRLYEPAHTGLTDGRVSYFGSLTSMPAGERGVKVMEALRTGATSDRYWIRYEVACHAHAPVELIEALADDPVAMVRRAVARHPYAASRLEVLARDADAGVRWEVARHDDADDALVARLRSDADMQVALAAQRTWKAREAAAALAPWDDAMPWADTSLLFDD